MHTNDLMKLQAEIAEAFDVRLEGAFSRALAARAAADLRKAPDFFEQLVQHRDDRHTHWDDDRQTLRTPWTAHRRAPMVDVTDVPFREVDDPPHA